MVNVKGGIPLKGTVTPIPNKNSMVACLPACILTNKLVEYKNLPQTSDIQKMLSILKNLGATVDDSDYKSVKIDCSTLNSYQVDRENGGSIRASILFAGPLLARFGKARIPMPGGCSLGQRSISAHIDVFSKLDVSFVFDDDYVEFTAPSKVEASYRVWQWEASVTGTENFVMYAAGMESEFTLIDAACEPHVTSLVQMISDMGADVEGINSNRLIIRGSKSMGGAVFNPLPDFVDIAGFIVAAAITKGNIRIKDGYYPDIADGIIQAFRKFHINITVDGNDIVVDGANSDLYIDTHNSGIPLATEDMPKFLPRPWPGFPVDVLPVVATLATKTKGRLLVQNWMYESGLDFVRELSAMGAHIFMADPQRIIISGPCTYKGGIVSPPSVIQAVKAVFLASLCDDAETVIRGVHPLFRRYPDIFTIYKSLGANITELD